VRLTDLQAVVGELAIRQTDDGRADHANVS
jgi:hypothetical protein